MINDVQKWQLYGNFKNNFKYAKCAHHYPMAYEMRGHREW